MSVVGGVPAGALGGLGDLLGGRAVEQQRGDPLEQPLADPAGGLGLVGVAGDRGRGQLVDVGEDQLGEVGEHLGGQPVAHRDRGQLAPRDPGADPERREQRVGGPAAAGLAAAELVGALDGRGGRRAQVLGAAPAGQGQEAAERELDGVADRLAHRPGERVAIARVPPRRWPPRRRRRPPRAGRASPRRRRRAARGRARRCCWCAGLRILSPANKCDVVVHVHRT